MRDTLDCRAWSDRRDRPAMSELVAKTVPSERRDGPERRELQANQDFRGSRDKLVTPEETAQEVRLGRLVRWDKEALPEPPDNEATREQLEHVAIREHREPREWLEDVATMDLSALPEVPELPASRASPALRVKLGRRARRAQRDRRV